MLHTCTKKKWSINPLDSEWDEIQYMNLEEAGPAFQCEDIILRTTRWPYWLLLAYFRSQQGLNREYLPKEHLQIKREFENMGKMSGEKIPHISTQFQSSELYLQKGEEDLRRSLIIGKTLLHKRKSVSKRESSLKKTLDRGAGTAGVINSASTEGQRESVHLHFRRRYLRMASTLPAPLSTPHRAVRTSGKPHSCAECRSLPPRPRLLAEDAVKLSKTIAELTNRCRQLEEALRTLQAKYSNECHPLLDSNLLTSSHAEQLVTPTNDHSHHDEDQDELDAVQDSLGTLTIDGGKANFLGRTAGMHLNDPLQIQQSDDPEVTDLLPPIMQGIASETLPTWVIFSNLSERKVSVMDHMRSYLPSSEKAWSLSEIYFEHAAWLVHPITRDYFVNEIFEPIYSPNSSNTNGGGNSHRDRPESHELALLFMVFSLATLLDMSLPPNNVEAEFYHQLARAGLSCDPILVEPTVPAIQTLLLMSFYHWLGNRKHSEQISWGIMGLVINLSQNIGLHRDSAAWRLLDPKTMERQRLLFWELYSLELTEALNFGRPPSLSLSTIDCKMPDDATQFAFTNDDLDPPFHSTKYRFFSVYLAPVIEAILGAKTANYTTVLALDRRVRDQDVAPLIEFDTGRAPGAPIVDLTGPSLGVTMQKFMIVAWPHLTLLYLHRGYFVRALSEHQASQNLLEGRYAPSVLAIFRTSCVIIAMLQALEKVNGELAKRFWLYWCHGLAAAIVVGSIVAKAPDCPLAQPALDQINAAYALFEKAAQHQEPIGRPAKALAIITRLRYRAHQAFTRLHSGKHSLVTENPDNPDDEELHILGGHTRIVAGRASSSPSTGNSTHSPASANSPEGQYRSSPKNNGHRGFTPETLDKAHPALLADLRTTKECEQVPPYPHGQPHMSNNQGYDPTMYSQPKYASSAGTQSQPPVTSMPPSTNGARTQPIVEATWSNNTGHSQPPPPPSNSNSTYLPPPAYVPPPSDTQAPYGMMGGYPDWDNQWHTFMDQLGMFSNDPTVPLPYATSAQMKMER
ncbi:hypothetical protein Clacol_004797 [Clathrus columnatus]|uniref:Xylanolytic transcriptional activator regulatory domain-containing protein n=1 Tax=Clathrus columnatus TaxID=1419009 RepID=A0AAV5AF41_9AGAM|nr:hypothetical protein Clacol_004797 [Clathrus columnatus]